MTVYFIQAFIYLAAAVVTVPLAKKLGLGSVLGYLVAGVIIGPIAGIVGQETVTIQHFAEFGVVMMLFLVGLELQPQMLWKMKTQLLGLGGLQVTLTAGVITLVAIAFGQPTTVAIAIGLIFSLSSTAIVLQSFNEKSLSKTEGGKSAFSVLLMQDIAVIPILAFIPLLALPELLAVAEQSKAAVEQHHELSLVDGLPTWAYALAIFTSIVGVIGLGHYLSRPLFHYVAASGLREVFVATALLIVIGIAALMSLVGLSPALGTFLAGVVLANSEFRHELESNIEPFKGLLLGLFFITVGAGISFEVFADEITSVLLLTAAVMLTKALVLWGLATTFKVRNSDRWLFALSLAQAGEFGFVLLSFTVQNYVIPSDIAGILQLVIALSMFLTPLLFIFFDKIILPKHQQSKPKQSFDKIDDSGKVIIAGVGRFGQIINRFLTANNIQTVAIDLNATQVKNLQGINVKSYFGDATRPELLHTAGIEEAALVVVAIDDRESAKTLVQYIKHKYPEKTVLARAFDRGHSYELKHLGADLVVKETYHSALEMSAKALVSLGFHPFVAEQKKHVFYKTEDQASEPLFDKWKHGSEGKQFDQDFTKLFLQLEEAIGIAIKADRTGKCSHDERGWTPPPKGYTERE